MIEEEIKLKKMLEQEIINNKIQQILSYLSGELSMGLILAENNSAFLINTQDLTVMEALAARYQSMELNGILSLETNGLCAFLNALKVIRELLSVLRVPNVMGSELLRERTNYYVNGLYDAYKEERKMVIDPKKMDYHMMATFSEKCIKEEWVDLENYRLEALQKCQSKEEMCEYIRKNYENRKKRKLKVIKK